MKRFFQTYWLSLLVAAAILYLSLATGRGLAKLPPIPLFENADKLMHFMMYMCLSCVITFNQRMSGKALLLTAFTAIAISVAYGGVIELVQPFFPPRTCDLLDFIADSAGAIVGFVITDIIWIQARSHIR